MCAYHLERGGQQLIIFLIPLIATVSMAVVTDFRSWKIPNKLVAVGLIQGFVVSAVVRGLPEGAPQQRKGMCDSGGDLICIISNQSLGGRGYQTSGGCRIVCWSGHIQGYDLLLFGRGSNFYYLSFKRVYFINYES